MVKSSSPASTAITVTRWILVKLQRELTDHGFSYNLIRSAKRKTLSIIIRANSDVDVLVPTRTPIAFVEQFVSSKSAWIKKKLHFNSEIRPSVKLKTFTRDEPFLFKGNTVNLDIQTGRRAVAIVENKLTVTLPASTAVEKKTALIRRVIEKWYRQQAEIHLKQRTEQLAKVLGKSPTHVGVKGYRSRWGSCHLDGRIYFNWRLIMAPEWVIDYVILHELCHLIHHNHSKNYWALVESVMPDYRHAKVWLKTNCNTLDL
nr:SprT family zinc-dependent metalloprotease [Mariprofundus sp. KV]